MRRRQILQNIGGMFIGSGSMVMGKGPDRLSDAKKSGGQNGWESGQANPENIEEEKTNRSGGVSIDRIYIAELADLKAKINTTDLIQAISDYRNDNISSTTLKQVVTLWRSSDNLQAEFNAVVEEENSGSLTFYNLTVTHTGDVPVKARVVLIDRMAPRREFVEVIEPGDTYTVGTIEKGPRVTIKIIGEDLSWIKTGVSGRYSGREPQID